MVSIARLVEILRSAGADFELIRQDRPIRSAKDAEEYYPAEKAAPTLVLQSESGLIACIVSANRGRLDFGFMKQQFGFSKLKMASADKVQQQTGYQVGAIPLVGLELPCIFDESLLQFDYIYGGSGDELLTLKIRPADVKKINQIIGILPGK